MILPRRELVMLGVGIVVGHFLIPTDIHAQALSAAAGLGTPGVPATDGGTAAAITKMFTDFVRRFSWGKRQPPDWVPLAVAFVAGPVAVWLLYVAANRIVEGASGIANIIIGGLLAGTGGAVLLTQVSAMSRAPEANIPTPVAKLSPDDRAALCCTNPDCANVRGRLPNPAVASTLPTPPNPAAPLRG